MNHLTKISVLLLACFLLVPEAQAASFRPLGFSGDGYGVSDDGGVVVGTDCSGWTCTAFRWTPENGTELLGLLPGGVAYSTARAVSADGRVIVGWSDSDSPDGDEAFRWTESTGMQKIGDLGGEQRGEANAVNANGSVIVGLSTSELGVEAFRWTAAGGMVGLGDIPDGQFASSAEGVSADGNVVVGQGTGPSFSREAFRWTEAGGIVTLGQLSGGRDRSWAIGVSPDGSAVVGSASSADGEQAFLWTSAGGMIGLGDLSGDTFYSRALDASTNGEVVVGFSDTDPYFWEAFVWTQTDGMRRLIDVLLDNGATGLDGWIITSARAISANGLWVVGTARPPDGTSDQPYLAYLGEGEPPSYGQFGDVTTTHWAFDFIERLAESGITSGCGGGNYCPDDEVTRAQMAVFLERGMRGSDFRPPAASGNVFLDVATGDFAAAFIEQFYLDGITSGCGGMNYCPADSVTRAQMAVFLLRAKYGAWYLPPAPSGVFSDVPVGSFADAWIEQLAAEGITGGCGAGNFCPDDPVTRAQMAVFLVRTFGL